MLSIDSETVLSWIGHALTWYVVGLLAAIGIAQYVFDALKQVPSREAMKAFALIQVAACILYFIVLAWCWLSLQSVDIRSILGQIVLAISAIIINASVLMLVGIWLGRPKREETTA